MMEIFTCTWTRKVYRFTLKELINSLLNTDMWGSYKSKTIQKCYHCAYFCNGHLIWKWSVLELKYCITLDQTPQKPVHNLSKRQSLCALWFEWNIMTCYLNFISQGKGALYLSLYTLFSYCGRLLERVHVMDAYKTDLGWRFEACRKQYFGPKILYCGVITVIYLPMETEHPQTLIVN